MSNEVSASPQTTQNQVNEQKTNDKELNFRALESKYRQQLEQERQARLEVERQLQERSQAALHDDEDEDSSEPYIDDKKLKKTLSKFEQKNAQQTKSEIQQAVSMAIKEERRQNWLKNNADFYDVLQHADKLPEADPELAETILEMPEGFERQKLVYKNIKALGLHKPKIPEPSIQDKINANRRSPYYQPSGVGTAPYASQGDFTAAGQKSAYEKMQALKNQLRLG